MHCTSVLKPVTRDSSHLRSAHKEDNLGNFPLLMLPQNPRSQVPKSHFSNFPSVPFTQSPFHLVTQDTSAVSSIKTPPKLWCGHLGRFPQNGPRYPHHSFGKNFPTQGAVGRLVLYQSKPHRPSLTCQQISLTFFL